MWGTFACAFVVGIVVLYMPGYLLLRALRFGRLASVCCAPVVALLAYPLLGVVYERIGVFATWATVCVPVVAVCLVAWVVSLAARRRGARRLPSATLVPEPEAGGMPPARRDGALVLWYVVAGLAVGIALFASRLSSPDAIFQWVDTVHHLSQVRNYLDSGSWSMFEVNMYRGAGEGAFNPYGPGAFYPSTWHCVAAIMAGATGASVPIATNAAILAFSSVVYPLSTLFAVRALFPHDVRAAFLAPAVALLCSAFPWGFSYAGPLYPNLAGMSAAPIALGLGAVVVRHGPPRRDRVRAFVLLIVSLVPLALAHPNVPFSVALALAPAAVAFATHPINRASFDVPPAARRAAKAACAVAAAAAVAAVWYLLFTAPFLHDVVWFEWDAFRPPASAALAAVFADFRETVPNIVFGALAIAGCAVVARRRESVWVVASFALAVAVYVAAASGEGLLKHVLAGFWYTDFYRIGATVLLVAVPLAASGLSALAGAVFRAAVRRRHGLSDEGAAPRLAAASTAGCLIAVVALQIAPVWPALSPHAPGAASVASPNSQALVAASSIQGRYTYGPPAVYDAEERAFVRKVIEAVGDDGPILNDPNDGTMYAYGADGLDVVFRYFYGETPDATDDGRIVRLGLADIASDQRVREAVERMGARYVIQLDRNPSLFTYNPGEWVGIDAVADDTPGFELVLAEGDMRLYRIAL